MELRYHAADREPQLHVSERDGSLVVTVNGRELVMDEVSIDERHVTLVIDGRRHRLLYASRGAHLMVSVAGHGWEFVPAEEAEDEEVEAAGGFTPELNSPMPGKVLDVLVAEGDVVEAGQALLLLEAMKMETTLKAPAPARVAEIKATTGTMVGPGDTLVRLEPLESD